MNQLSDDRVAALASAYASGMSLRKAATVCGVTRETVLRYYREFEGAPALTPQAAAPKPPSGRRDRLLELARDILSPDIVERIDENLRELALEHEELLLARRVAERMHGP